MIKDRIVTEDSILKTLRTGVVIHAPDTSILYSNPRAAELLGMTQDQLHGRTALDPQWHFLDETGNLLPVEEYPISKVIASQTELDEMILGINSPANKHCVWVLVNATPEFDENGVLTHIAINFHDISKQKEIERNLEETVLRLEESINAGGIGLWDWDLKTNRVNFSKEYKKQIGYEEDELLNDLKEFEERVHPDDVNKLFQSVQKSIDDRSQYHTAEFRLRHKDSSYRWILAHASVIQDKDSQPARMLGSHIDVTELKTLEEKLHQSQKMEAIGQLAGGVAHDFNNCLASILGYAEILKQQLDNPDLAEFADKIISSAERSGNLTKQMLSFSRKRKLSLCAVDIHQQILETWDLVKVSIDKRVTLDLNLDAQECIVNGDKSQIQNALLNLALNARDAMPNGGVLTITTEVENRKTESSTKLGFTCCKGKYIKISFRDTGHGINQSDILRLFEPFYTTKPVGKGTGMGLASVFGAVEQHKGCIDVESEVGVGSCFMIYMPLNNSVGDVQASNDVSPALNHPLVKELTILVADDEPEVREICEEVLTTHGYKVLLAENGHEAVELYQNHLTSIDLVILDMMMPVMHGKEAYIAMKELNPNIKAIISTGFDHNLLAGEAFEGGSVVVIEKPFKLASLLETVQHTLEVNEESP